jgi:hypothetical protein
MSEARRILMEQFGDIEIPGLEQEQQPAPEPMPQQTAPQPSVSAMDHLRDAMPDVAANEDYQKIFNIDRLEIIDRVGRAYVNENVTNITLSFQDGDKTLKIMLE